MLRRCPNVSVSSVTILQTLSSDHLTVIGGYLVTWPQYSPLIGPNVIVSVALLYEKFCRESVSSLFLSVFWLILLENENINIWPNVCWQCRLSAMAKEAEALMSPVTIVQTLSLLTAHYIELIVASFWDPQIHSRGVPYLLIM